MKKTLRQSATLLVGLLLASNSIFCESDGFSIFVATPEQAVQLMIAIYAENEKEEVDRITDVDELDNRMRKLLAMRQAKLVECEQENQNRQVCHSSVSFLETLILISLARKEELRDALNKINSSGDVQEIDAAVADQQTRQE